MGIFARANLSLPRSFDAVTCSRSRGKKRLRSEKVRVKSRTEQKRGQKSQLDFKVGARTQLPLHKTAIACLEFYFVSFHQLKRWFLLV